MAFLCSHIHLTSITLSLGDFVGKNTSVILGWCFDNASLVFFDLCIDALSIPENILLIFKS